MVEGKILPDRQHGQSWRRMLARMEGRERGMNPMIVDKVRIVLFHIRLKRELKCMTARCSGSG
jgi:hypothetical protein